MFNPDLHWSNKTGVFTDGLIHKQKHPYEKPESLIERLLRIHVPANGLVLDPFAGSGTIGKTAERIGMNHISIEKDSKWVSLWNKI